jgi:glycerophosphoryl diester phosphodiesterase
MNYWTQSPRNIYVAAHRGWCSEYPENTLLAFRKALEVGVDQIETDIRITKDGELVLMHDATVDRTTNGTGKVCEMTLAELKELDAGGGEKIPTLRELMELVKDEPRLTLDYELKEYPTEGWEETAYEVADRVIAMAEEYGFGDRCVINSFSGKLNEYVLKRYEGKYRQHVFYPVDCLGECTIDPYSYAYCCCMFGPEEDKKQAYADMAARGVQPWAGASVKDEATLDQVIEYGAYLITCNNPDVILELLRQKGYHE